jgi:hypothetical protein
MVPFEAWQQRAVDRAGDRQGSKSGLEHEAPSRPRVVPEMMLTISCVWILTNADHALALCRQPQTRGPVFPQPTYGVKQSAAAALTVRTLRLARALSIYGPIGLERFRRSRVLIVLWRVWMWAYDPCR